MTWIKPDWPVADNVHSAVTLRTGGLSQGAFQSLNPALHVNDDPETVLQNRKAISKMLNLPAEPVWLEQTHSDRVIKAEQSIRLEKADASYTDQAGVVSVVMTADCLPVLLASRDGTQIAAIHAGWRGLLAGIISNTAAEFNANDTMAWLGPAIGPDCFEVGSEVKSSFISKSAEFSPAFKQISEQKFLADIYQLATIELAMLGITQVYGGGFCTVTDRRRFYSYRRDGETGRMATLIWRD
jgi:YfiH family protein